MLKKRIRLTLGIVALLFMVVAPLAVASGQASKDAPYRIQYFLNAKKVGSSDETRVGKIIKEKFNIVFDYVPFTDYEQKQNLMLAAGDYPDLLRLQEETGLQKYLNAGAVLPLDSYLKDAPNFRQRYKDLIPFWRLSSPDGKLYKWEYWVPQDKFVNVQNYDITVRTDALEKQGWPKLVSTDDYVRFLSQAAKDFPTTNGRRTLGMIAPFGEPWGVAGIMGDLYEKTDTYSSAGRNGAVLWNIKTRQFESYLHNSYYKESLQFFNKLYQLGLLDTENFTDHLDQFNVKMESGQALAGWYCTWEVPTANAKLIAAGHPEQQYIVLPVQSNTTVKEGQKREMTLEGARPFDSVVITKNAKDPARIFKLVEWAASEEGQMLLQSGVEGVDYVVKNGKRTPTDMVVQALGGHNADYGEQAGVGLFSWLGQASTLAKDGVAYDFSRDPAIKDQYALTDRQKQAFQSMGWKNSTEWWAKNGIDAPEAIAWTIAIDPSTDLGRLYQKLTEYRVKESAQLVLSKTDQEFEAGYKKMLDGYESFDYKSVIAKYNELLAAKEAALKKVR